MIIVTHQLAKEIGYCNHGIRSWFERRSVTFDQFRREGVTLEWLREQRDGMADRLADIAEERARG